MVVCHILSCMHLFPVLDTSLGAGLILFIVNISLENVIHTATITKIKTCIYMYCSSEDGICIYVGNVAHLRLKSLYSDYAILQMYNHHILWSRYLENIILSIYNIFSYISLYKAYIILAHMVDNDSNTENIKGYFQSFRIKSRLSFQIASK